LVVCSRGQTLQKVGHIQGARQIEQPRILLSFYHRNIAIVNASESIRAHRAVIRLLHEIENEGNRQDCDHDHEPLPMPAQKCHHSLNTLSTIRVAARNLRRVPTTPNIFWRHDLSLPAVAGVIPNVMAVTKRIPPLEMRHNFANSALN